MEPEKVVLVSLQNRTREAHLQTSDSKDDAANLEKAVRTTFSDLSSLTDACQLILQVCMYMYVPLCV